ncbi:DUF2946 family protein [Inhella sp.]|uniref:DUF2946 family protein n=1 Tax=Inhella sp. TaxID=1921806 RepID=UPI0035AE3431
MDEIVRQAMAKWPNVPACYDWLALDARGQWFMRDEACQRAGVFPNPKGSPIRHEKLIGFIQRNYLPDDSGAWYFQNGPQRVYVTLEAAPLVLRLLECGGVEAHTGEPLEVSASVLDEEGWLYLLTERGLGLVHSQDMHRAVERIEGGYWQPDLVIRAELPTRFGFVRRPQTSP